MEIRAAIDNHKILKGMTSEQVLLSLGICGCRDRSFEGDNLKEVWCYEPDEHGQPSATIGCELCTQFIFFENGIVVNWKNFQGR